MSYELEIARARVRQLAGQILHEKVMNHLAENDSCDYSEAFSVVRSDPANADVVNKYSGKS